MNNDKQLDDKKKIPDTGTNTTTVSDDDDTASILFASNTNAKSMSNMEEFANVGEVSCSLSAPDNGQIKTGSSRISNLPSFTQASNDPSKQTSNSVNIMDLPNIPWPEDQSVICSVRELYKDYVDQSDPFLKPLPKMPPRKVQMPDPKLPKLPKQGGFCQNFAKLDAELKKLKEKMKAQEKEAEIKDKDDSSEGGNDDSDKTE